MFNLQTSQSPPTSPTDMKTLSSQDSFQVLVKSRTCLDKLHYKFQNSPSITNAGSKETLRCLNQTAKEINMQINGKMNETFNQLLNSPTHLPLPQDPQAPKEKEEGIKKLMGEYWKKEAYAYSSNSVISENKRNNSQDNTYSNYSRDNHSRDNKSRDGKEYNKYKDNKLPRLGQEVEYVENSRKKQVFSSINSNPSSPSNGANYSNPLNSLNVKMYEKQKEMENQRKNKEEKILAYLYGWMVQVVDFKVQNDTSEFLIFQKTNYLKWDEIDNVLRSIELFTKKYDIKYCTLDLQKVLQLIDIKGKLTKNNKLTKKSLTNLANASNTGITTNFVSSLNFGNSSNNGNAQNFQYLESGNKRVFTPHELLACLENAEEISVQNYKKPGIRFFGTKGKIRAITKIQSVWRGRLAFLNYKKEHEKLMKIIKIQRNFRLFKKYSETKNKIKEKLEEKILWFKDKQSKLGQEYRECELLGKIKYEIHICCDSQTSWQRVSTPLPNHHHNAYITRIFGALNSPETRAIFVTALGLPSEILSYYKKLFELSGVDSFASKIYFVTVEEMLVEKVGICRGLLYDSKALTKIKSIVSSNFSYIVPSTSSMDFIPLCWELGVGLWGGMPQSMLYLQSKSGSKELLQEENITESLPSATNIYSMDTLSSELSSLIERNPFIQRWMFKIDNEFNSRGLAFVETSKLVPKKIINFLRKEHQEREQRNKENQEKEDKYKNERKSEEKSFLMNELPSLIKLALSEGEKITIVCPEVYRSQSEYFGFMFSNGGIIEAELPSAQSLNCCVQIYPDGEYKIISHYQRICNNKRTVGCYYSPELPTPSISEIEKIVKQIRKRKCFGYFTFKFLWKAETHSYLYGNLSKTKKSANSNIQENIKNISGSIQRNTSGNTEESMSGNISENIEGSISGKLNQNVEGKLNVNNSGNESVEYSPNFLLLSVKPSMDIYSSASCMYNFIAKNSHVLYIPIIVHSTIKKLSIQSFFHLCRLQNVSFDIERKIGNVFTFVDGMESGCIGVMTFNPDSKPQTFIHCAEVLDFLHTGFTSTPVPSKAEPSFMALRNCVNGYLGHLRKEANSKKSWQEKSQENRHNRTLELNKHQKDSKLGRNTEKEETSSDESYNNSDKSSTVEKVNKLKEKQQSTEKKQKENRQILRRVESYKDYKEKDFLC